jgi:hypothetical protein
VTGAGPGPPTLVYNAWAPDYSYPDLSSPNWNNNSFPSYIGNSYGAHYAGTLFIYIGQANLKTNGNVYGEMTLLQCLLYNASYEVSFSFSGSDQDIKVRNVTYHGASTVDSEVQDQTAAGYPDLDAPSSAYTAVMWAFGQLLDGNGITNPYGGQFAPDYTGTLAQITSLRKFIEGPESPEFSAIKSVVEEIFWNITISFLSYDQFL